MIDNDGILNTMIRNCTCEILQNLHFSDNRKDHKTDKAFKMKPVIDHLNSKFSEVISINFANNRKDDKTDKTFKMRPVIDHLNSKLSEVLSNNSEQRIDEHMVKSQSRFEWGSHKIKTNKMGLYVLVMSRTHFRVNPHSIFV